MIIFSIVKYGVDDHRSDFLATPCQNAYTTYVYWKILFNPGAFQINSSTEIVIDKRALFFCIL